MAESIAHCAQYGASGNSGSRAEKVALNLLLGAYSHPFSVTVTRYLRLNNSERKSSVCFTACAWAAVSSEGSADSLGDSFPVQADCPRSPRDPFPSDPGVPSPLPAFSLTSAW